MNIKITSNSRQVAKKIVTLFGTVLAMSIFGNATYEIKELIGPAKSMLESLIIHRTDKALLQSNGNPINSTTGGDTTSIKF